MGGGGRAFPGDRAPCVGQSFLGVVGVVPSDDGRAFAGLDGLGDEAAGVALVFEPEGYGRAAFVADTMIQDAVMRNLEIIGEATKNLPVEFRRFHPEVDWRGAMALRNVLIHNYISVNVPRVWIVVTRKLPKLKAQIAALVKADGEPSS